MAFVILKDRDTDSSNVIESLPSSDSMVPLTENLESKEDEIYSQLCVMFT